jgi:hypothetical protein
MKCGFIMQFCFVFLPFVCANCQNIFFVFIFFLFVQCCSRSYFARAESFFLHNCLMGPIKFDDAL